jgi:hypothetical protein
MLKKTITFDDFNGGTITEDFFFNLTKAELVELELSEKNGLAQTLKDIVASEDGTLIIEHFKKIILMAYGKKSDDGRRFIKSEQMREDFAQTEAYSNLFVELATNAEAAAAFVNGVVPKGLEADLANLPAVESTPSVDEVDSRPAWLKENRQPTAEEMRNMSREQLVQAMQMKSQQDL